MDTNFDLTSKDGLKKAAEFVERHKIWRLPFLPHYYLLKGLKSLFGSNSPFSAPPTEQQIEAVKDLIKTGKERGVKTMKFRVDKRVGFSIGSEVNGIPIHTTLGTDQTMLLEVEFK